MHNDYFTNILVGQRWLGVCNASIRLAMFPVPEGFNMYRRSAVCWTLFGWSNFTLEEDFRKWFCKSLTIQGWNKSQLLNLWVTWVCSLQLCLTLWQTSPQNCEFFSGSCSEKNIVVRNRRVCCLALKYHNVIWHVGWKCSARVVFRFFTKSLRSHYEFAFHSSLERVAIAKPVMSLKQP